VDRTEFGDSPIDQLLDRLLVCEVELNGDRPTAGRSDALCGGLRPGDVDVANGD
jgi:hypothetical protein